MELTDTQLTELEGLAGVFLSLQEIATIMQLDIEKLQIAAENPASLIHQTIHRGRLKKKAELRQIIFTMAMGGSAPAQNLALKFMQKAEIDAF